VTVLVGAKAICELLGVSPRRIAMIYAAGAPIKRLGEGRGVRYLAFEASLRCWIEASSDIIRHHPTSSDI
jgi:phage terminase Nu1 subunit (DNA packaging protein)